MAEAVQEFTGKRYQTVVAVGDCRPAAIALTSARSRSSVMRPILAEWRQTGQQLLGVWVPRELNTDADRLSHPSLRAEVEKDAVKAGFRVVWLEVPVRCWQTALRAAGAAGWVHSHSRMTFGGGPAFAVRVSLRRPSLLGCAQARRP